MGLPELWRRVQARQPWPVAGPLAGLPAPALPLRVQCELDDWDSAIAALDAALADAAAARSDVADAEREADLLEARTLLGITGSNESMRKAALAVTLSESIAYQDITTEARAARERLADAERCVVILKERCRLHRSAVATALGTQDA